MAFEHYIYSNGKKLRCGFTTGTCAALAASGAAQRLLTGRWPASVSLRTPKGLLVEVPLEDCRMEGPSAVCGVRKDGGDDVDQTTGALVQAAVSPSVQPGISIEGGPGVGRVTRPGLDQPVGSAAINRVPRQMIREQVASLCRQTGYEGGLQVTISVPAGEQIAQRTFNPRLGIEGGISILGTSGIVEPMSEKALVESIHVEMKQHFTQGEKYLLVTPGNYGADYLREHMTLPFERNIKCSNYVGETIDMGVKGILFVAHIGKFVKVAAGIMNTHSHSADARMEVLAANALRVGADGDTARDILNCNTTDDALDILHEKGLLEPAMQEIMERIQFYLDHRSYEQIKLGAVVFNNVYGYLGKRDAGELIQEIQKQDEMLKLQM